MPSTEFIISTLTNLVNDYKYFSIIWHLFFFALIIFIYNKNKPSNKITSIILIIPLLSVSMFAIIQKNPFNSIIFGLLFIVLLIIGLKLSDEKIKISINFWTISGLILIAFGWIYPHFLNSNFILYLIMAPIGIIPCPTLSIIIGFALLLNGFDSKLWTITLSLIGIFYGLTGTLALKVYIDIILLAGSVILMSMAIFKIKKRNI